MLLETLTIVQGWMASLTAFVAVAVGGSNLVAGGIIATTMGSLMYLLRRVPRVVIYWIDRYCFFTYTLTYHVNARSSSQFQTVDVKFGQLLSNAIYKKIQHKQPMAKLDIINNTLTETVHPGRFMFSHHGMPVIGSFVIENKKDTDDGVVIPTTIRLKTLRSFRAKLYKFIGNCYPETSMPGVHSISMQHPYNPTIVRYRTLANEPDVELDPELKAEIDEAIELYLANRDYRNENNIPHKLTFMFYGPPGHGKSTLGEYIAHKLNSSLFVVRMSDHGFQGPDISMYIDGIKNHIRVGGIPVLLADDFDTYWTGIGARDRSEQILDSEGVPLELTLHQKNILAKKAEMNTRNLGMLLGSLQSSIAINDAVVIFNTNHLEKVDPAVYRPGRITLLREVGPMSPASIKQYFNKSYGKQWPTDIICRGWRACDISGFKEKANGCPDKFLELASSETTVVEKPEELTV